MNLQTVEQARDLFRLLGKAFECPDDDWWRPGVDDQVLIDIEQRLGIKLPDEYVAIFKQFNGFMVRVSLLHGGELFTGFELSPIESWEDPESIEAIQDYFGLTGTDISESEFAETAISSRGPVKKMLWHPRWFPLTFPSAHYAWYADFSPEPGGRDGQVVFVNSQDYDNVVVEVVAADFFSFMSLVIESAPLDR